ncbi:MAG: diaminopimelate decarboxylase [Oscillospiraceae bacterium]|nr:diaminopimelate decarboxylase [Oscillospiraceae bacterium]
MIPMLTPNLTVSENGTLCIGGADTVQLAKEHGTPLYVMDENMIRENCRGYHEVIAEEYGGNGLICFASKALSCKELYRIVDSEGLGADVISGGELYTALQAGMPAEKIVMHGNSKSDAELKMALETGVGRIVADNLPELKRLNGIAGELGKKARIMLRIKPGIDAHTHDFVKTGCIDSKFGFALETGEALAAVQAAFAYPNLELTGLHCHIGSQILDTEPFAEAARVMLGFMDTVRKTCGITLPELNLGGGPGIRYTEKDDPPAFGSIVRAILSALKSICKDLNFPEPFVLFEPGRSIVGGAGLTLYTVMARKTIPGIRTYVLVDGGMCDNPRYALYGSEYEAMIAGKAGMPRSERVTIGGKCCESGDLIGENMPLQPAEEGDILAVLATGAYNYSMASNYNRNPRAEMVMVKDGEARTVIRRESYEDIVRNDL